MQRESTGPALKTLRSGRQAGCLREKATLPNRGLEDGRPWLRGDPEDKWEKYLGLAFLE